MGCTRALGAIASGMPKGIKWNSHLNKCSKISLSCWRKWWESHILWEINAKSKYSQLLLINLCFRFHLPDWLLSIVNWKHIFHSTFLQIKKLANSLKQKHGLFLIFSPSKPLLTTPISPSPYIDYYIISQRSLWCHCSNLVIIYRKGVKGETR